MPKHLVCSGTPDPRSCCFLDDFTQAKITGKYPESCNFMDIFSTLAWEIRESQRDLLTQNILWEHPCVSHCLLALDVLVGCRDYY